MKKIALIFFLTLFLFVYCTRTKVEKESTPGQLKPGTIEYIMNEACFYLNNGRLNLAEKKFLSVLEKNPNHENAINGLGIIYLNKREFDKAENNFKMLVKINPGYIDAYNSLGIIYIEKKEYELAKDSLLIAANSDEYRTPENAYLNLANLEMRRDKYENAIRYVEKGLIKNKSFAPLYNLKGLIFEYQKNYRDAIYNFKKALSFFEEEDISYLVNIGRVYAKMKEKNKALDVLEKALTKAPSELYKKEIKKLIKQIEKK